MLDADNDNGTTYVNAGTTPVAPQITFNIVTRNHRTRLIECIHTQRDAIIAKVSHIDAGHFRTLVDELLEQANLITTEITHEG